MICFFAFCLLVNIARVCNVHAQNNNFTCFDGTQIQMLKFCDGREDCFDGSDEIVTSTNCSECEIDQISCKMTSSNRTCAINRKYVCDSYVRCDDVDLCDAGCPSHYRCQGEHKLCVERSGLCCGENVMGCLENHGFKNGIGFQCVRKGALCMLPQQLLWDGVEDCDRGEDLCYISSSSGDDGRDLRHRSSVKFDRAKCFKCLDDSMIVPRHKVCDGVVDCSDLTDECLCENVPEICNYVTMRGGSGRKKLPSNTTCDVGEVTCGDGTCVKRSAVCDSTGDCWDNRDEKYSYCAGTLQCQDGLVSDFGHKCRCGLACFGYVNRRWNYGNAFDKTWSPVIEGIATICDGRNECLISGTSDERVSGCSAPPPEKVIPLTESHKRCTEAAEVFSQPSFDGPLHVGDLYFYNSFFSALEICNGFVECSLSPIEGSTETISLPDYAEVDGNRPYSYEEDGYGYGGEYHSNSYDEYNPNLYNYPPSFPPTSQLNKTKRSLSRTDNSKNNRSISNDTSSSEMEEYGLDEVNCTDRYYCKANRDVSVRKSAVCNGRVDCDSGEDETYCPERFYCKAGDLISLPLAALCDGVVVCDDGEDEAEEICPQRFPCSNVDGVRVSVANETVCDGIIDCVDALDELNCHSDGRFYCEDKSPLFVTKEKIFDGHGDCDDLSDECPSGTRFSNDDPFSSRYHLIANPILRAIVWIMGVLAICGNGIVVISEIRQLGRFESASMRANHLLVLNLAVADFFMGIYLLMLAIMDAIFSGVYCVNSLRWLSSATCLTMGVLVVFSSECSVVTMILLTSLRLYIILKPFKASLSPKLVSVLIMIAMSWIIAAVIAALPFFPSLEHIFTDRATLADNPFFKSATASYDVVKVWAERMLTFDPNYASLPNETISEIRDATTWGQLQDILNKRGIVEQKTLDISRYYGYYSANSVCLPRIFVTSEEGSWPFSLAVNIFNFLAFIYVACTYIALYFTSKKKLMPTGNTSGGKRGKQSSAKRLQNKILRLVITDFCCWIPLCIMAFINFSGVPVSDVAYAITAIVLLPINSSLNPILYSNLVDKMVAKTRQNLTTVFSSVRSTSDGGVPGVQVEETQT
ncbi:unnamed protein product [Clavelina lepadiformis]|uniref:G-protein coupled receptors family 1 profile domain-containing protein n=1 Tax=Clavelina lepadiformis TaxID=159417 RepID=A0ABP0GMX7_CLALP